MNWYLLLVIVYQDIRVLKFDTWKKCNFLVMKSDVIVYKSENFRYKLLEQPNNSDTCKDPYRYKNNSENSDFKFFNISCIVGYPRYTFRTTICWGKRNGSSMGNLRIISWGSFYFFLFFDIFSYAKYIRKINHTACIKFAC